MDKVHILFFLCLGFHSVFCAPTSPAKSLYDVIVEKCPSVHSSATFKDQHIFKSCKDWKTISEVNKLTEDNKKDIRCLLYFESFTQYCTHAQTVNTTVSGDVVNKYSVDMVCDYVKKIPQQNLSNIFKTDDNCKKICLDDMGFVNSVCSSSLYFAQAALVPETKTEGSEKASQRIESKPVYAKQPAASKIQDAAKDEQQQHERPEIPLSSAKKLTKVVPNVPSQQIKNHDESRLSPSKDLKNNANVAIGEVLSGNATHNSVQASAVAPDTQEATPNKEAEVNPAENQENGNKAEETNPAPNVKILEPEENLAKQDSDVPQEQEKPVEAASVKGQTNNLESPNSDETDQDLEPDKEQSQLNPGVMDLEGMDEEGKKPDEQEDDKLESVVNGAQKDQSKPLNLKVEDSESVSYPTEMEGDSYFFTYFMVLCIIFIVGYVCYHNKQKILALILEGRKGKRQYRGRRPNSANYHKLDSNLEEAITSSCKKNTTNVIY